MGPAIFSGSRTKLLTSSGLLLQDGSTLDNDGVINYIKNGKAEVNTTGWLTYIDAAAASPVDGAGTASNSTFTRSTSSPLRGAASFLWTKSANDRQGEGFSYDFTINSADRYKVLQGSFDYAVSSGTFADDDMTVWIYDVTNAALIQPAPFKLKNHSLPAERFGIEFQASSSTSYRLIVHTASTSTSAYTLKFDNFNLGPQAKLYGSPVTDWVSYTPILTNFTSSGTNAIVSGRWRRVGDSAEIQTYVHMGSTGSGSSGSAQIGMPSGLTPLDSKSPRSDRTAWGSGVWNDGGSIKSYTASRAPASNAIVLWNDGTADVIQGPALSANDELWVTATIPITGWSSSTIMSSDANTRVVAAQVAGDPASATAGNPIIFPTITYDTHGAYNATTGGYTVPSSGYYRIHGYTNGDVAAITLRVYKNGSATGTRLGITMPTYFATSLSGTILANAGDILDVRPDGTYNAAATSVLNFEKITGPAQIAASDTVAARYTTAAGQNIVNNTTAAIVDFGTKAHDYTNSVTTGASWKFTAPISGLYSVKVLCQLSYSTTSAVSAQFNLRLYKNGSNYSDIAARDYDVGNNSQAVAAGSDEIRLLAGDYIDVRAVQNTGADRALTASASLNHISITRIGNY